MGGSGKYHPPVKSWTGVSTWRAHTNRSTPSIEPGTDFYCPRFTDLFAAASGRVADVSWSIVPATGRYITLDLDDGRRVRYLHLEDIYVGVGQRVAFGQVIGRTGATGYGESDWSWNVSQTGGAHVHMTLWAQQRYTFGRYATLDPQEYIEEDDMGTLDDNEENYQRIAKWIQRAFKWDVRSNGFGADSKLGPSVIDMLGNSVNAARAAEKAAGSIRLELTEEQLSKIAAEIKVDYVALAKAVNDEASRRLAS